MSGRSYDYVVVGAGSAGCVLASRLTEDPAVSVLLLEAGGWDRGPYIALPLAWGRLFAGRMYDWGYDSQPEPQLDGRVLDCARGKVIGGSSSVNAMAYGRGHPSDYDGWAARGLEEWAWEKVLPCFRRAETWERGPNEWRGGDGPLDTCEVPVEDPLVDAVFKAARDLQMPFTEDTNAEKQEGFGVPQFTIRRGRRCSASVAYLRPALKRRNLTVQPHALVDRVTFDGARARGVRFSVGGREEEAHATREVIVAAGTINTPPIMVRSGIGDADVLRQLGISVVREAPGVGRNLHDHLNVAHDCVRTDPGALHQRLRQDRFAAMVAEALVLRRGLATKLPMGVVGFLKSDRAGEACDLTFILRLSSAAPKQYWPWQTPEPDGIGYRVVMLKPESRGEIRTVSRNPADPPEILQNLLSTPGDWAVARQAMRLIARINAHPEVARFMREEIGIRLEEASEAELDAHIRRTANTVHHPVGTCRMGAADDPLAVLDGRLRVRGVEALRVVDASVMPEIVTGPINAPTMMIAERASDLIREDAAAAA